jgi:hypothetical protein
MKFVKFLVGLWLLLIWIITSFDWFPRWLSDRVDNQTIVVVVSIGFSVTFLAAIVAILMAWQQESRS